MWPFSKKDKSQNTEVDNNKNIETPVEDNKPTPKADVEKAPVKKPVAKKTVKKPVAKKKTTAKKKSAPKKATSKKVKEKIYVGDKNKIVTLRLSHDLLSKVKKHASENKKMTLSQFTRHLYNLELEKIENLKNKLNNNLNVEPEFE